MSISANNANSLKTCQICGLELSGFCQCVHIIWARASEVPSAPHTLQAMGAVGAQHQVGVPSASLDWASCLLFSKLSLTKEDRGTSYFI